MVSSEYYLTITLDSKGIISWKLNDDTEQLLSDVELETKMGCVVSRSCVPPLCSRNLGCHEWRLRLQPGRRPYSRVVVASQSSILNAICCPHSLWKSQKWCFSTRKERWDWQSTKSSGIRPHMLVAIIPLHLPLEGTLLINSAWISFVENILFSTQNM